MTGTDSHEIITIEPIDTSDANKALVEAGRYEGVLCELKIVDQATYDAAANMMTEVKKAAKTLEDRRKAITQPIDAAKKSVMDLFRPAQDKLTQIEASIKMAIITYSDEQEKKRQAEEDRLRKEAEKRAEKERERLEKQAQKAESKGQDDKAEELREQAEEVTAFTPIVQPQTQRPAGVMFKETWKARVVDKSKVPDVYKEINESLLNKQAQATKGQVPIPGVEFYKERQVAGKRS